MVLSFYVHTLQVTNLLLVGFVREHRIVWNLKLGAFLFFGIFLVDFDEVYLTLVNSFLEERFLFLVLFAHFQNMFVLKLGHNKEIPNAIGNPNRLIYTVKQACSCSCVLKIFNLIE